MATPPAPDDPWFELLTYGPAVVLRWTGSPTVLTYLSGNFQRILGLDPAPFLEGRQKISDRIPPEDVSAIQLGQGAFSGRIRFRDGTDRWRLLDHHTLRNQPDPGGEPAVLAYWLDVTEEVERRRRLELALEAARTGTWELTNPGGKIRVDREWALLTGTSREAVENLTMVRTRELIHPDDRDLWDQNRTSVLRGDTLAFDLELRFRDRNGRWSWFRLRGKVQETDHTGHPQRILGTLEDINDIVQAKEERSVLAQVVDQGPGAVILTDTSGTIEYVNRQFSALSGYSIEEVQGKNPRLLKHPDTPPQTHIDLWAAVTAGRVWTGEFQNLRKDGTGYWVQTSISPITGPSGRVTRYVGQQIDITARKRVEEQLRKAQEEADRANQAKTRFLAHMSHEIRTPMNGILGMAELLLEKNLDPESRALAEGIQTSGETLLTLVNDILDLTKIEAGKVDLEEVDFSLGKTIDSTVTPLQILAKKKDQTLVAETAPGVGDIRTGDPTRLRQILTNLVGNALKFTPRGGRVTVEVLDEIPGESLRFRVTDTGPGVPEANRHKLFQQFSQTDKSTTRNHGGTGLGLAICRELAESMGGAVGYEDSPTPPGGVFWCTVRVPLGSGTTEISDSQVPGAPPGKQLRVLVVEDNQINQQVAAGLLKALGVVPALASDGIEALDQLVDGAFDLVLMDVQMPILDGLSATRAIRKGQGGGRHLGVTIVAMTANAMSGDREECLAAGMNDYIAKPLTAASMARILNQWARPDLPAPKERSRRTFDPGEMRERLQLEEKLLGEIISMFLADLPRRRQEMVDALDRGDTPALARMAHSLKGTSANLVAQGVVDAAYDLEKAAKEGVTSEMGPLLADLIREMGFLEKALTEFPGIGN